MGWDSTTQRFCKQGGFTKIAANGRGDLQLALRSSSNKEIDLICNGDIATFARWHAVRSNLVSLPTEESRKTAGRTVAGDVTRQFGVHASGFGFNIILDDIHSCDFEYERPTAAEVSAHQLTLRTYDFCHPTINTYGYRRDAYFDFTGKIWNEGQTNLVIGTGGRDGIEITYDPHTAANGRIYEMISVKDFLTPDSPVAPSYDPNDMYPCVLITQGGYHFIHCLYNGSTDTLKTLGSGSGYWRIPGFTTGSGSGYLHSGEPAVISIFLASGRYLKGPSTGTDITSWIALPAASSGDMWVATFAPVPGACGLPCYIGSAPSSGVSVLIDGAQYDIRKTSLKVFLSIGNATSMTSDFSLRVTCDNSDTATTAIPIRAEQTGATASFALATAFPNCLFVTGMTNTFVVEVLKNGSTTGQDTRTFTLTY